MEQFYYCTYCSCCLLLYVFNHVIHQSMNIYITRLTIYITISLLHPWNNLCHPCSIRPYYMSLAVSFLFFVSLFAFSFLVYFLFFVSLFVFSFLVYSIEFNSFSTLVNFFFNS
jgi:tetrahydromethanopterin S-methyltransferase subunit C